MCVCLCVCVCVCVCGTTAGPSAGEALDSTGAVTGEAQAVALMQQMLLRMEHMEAKFEAQFAAMDAKFEAQFAAIDAKFETKLGAYVSQTYWWRSSGRYCGTSRTVCRKCCAPRCEI